MKVEIRYSIELTPEQYYDLRSNTDKYPKIFPKDSYSRATKIVEGKEEFTHFLLENLRKKFPKTP